jgi:hypothetical protein
VQDVDKEISEMKLGVNSRGSFPTASQRAAAQSPCLRVVAPAYTHHVTAGRVVASEFLKQFI